MWLTQSANGFTLFIQLGPGKVAPAKDGKGEEKRSLLADVNIDVNCKGYKIFKTLTLQMFFREENT